MGVAWAHGCSHRGCGQVTTLDMAMARDYIGHGPTDVSHDRWGLPELMVVHITVVFRWLHWTWPWPGDYIGHGPTDVSHERWGLPELMVVHIAVVARWLHWTRPDRCLPSIRKNLICDCWGSKYQCCHYFSSRDCPSGFYPLSLSLFLFPLWRLYTRGPSKLRPLGLIRPATAFSVVRLSGMILLSFVWFGF